MLIKNCDVRTQKTHINLLHFILQGKEKEGSNHVKKKMSQLWIPKHFQNQKSVAFPLPKSKDKNYHLGFKMSSTILGSRIILFLKIKIQ